MKIKLCGLSKRFGSTTILDSVESELGGGQVISLIGSNGAGKTTLLKMLATLSAPTSGEIYFDDQLLTRKRMDLRGRLHFLSDSPYFLSNNPVDHICLAAAYYNRSVEGLKTQIIDWLREFDLLEHADRPIATLSRGQKYKVAFVGLLAANPELWLLDEPFAAGVDPTGISVIKRKIDKRVGGGGTVIYTTQIVELASSFSDRILILNKGKLQVDSKTKDLNLDELAYGLAGVFEQLRMAK